MSKPRPIHTLHKSLRERPDESEPSYSYEETSFLAQREDDVEDEFHRRVAAASGGGGGRLGLGSRGGGGSGSGPGIAQTPPQPPGGTVTGSTGGGGGSFWRTDASLQWRPTSGGMLRGVSTGSSGGGGGGGGKTVNSNSNSNSNNNKKATNSPGEKSWSAPDVTLPQPESVRRPNSLLGARNVGGGGGGGGGKKGYGTKIDAAAAKVDDGNRSKTRDFQHLTMPPQRERKTSGGLLGAALQLHSMGGTHGRAETAPSSAGSASEKVSRRNGDSRGGTGSAEAAAELAPGNAAEAASGGAADPRDFVHRATSSLSQTSASSVGSAANGGIGGASSRDRSKRDVSKQRAEARRLKHIAQIHDVDIGHPIGLNDNNNDGSSHGGGDGLSSSVLDRGSGNVIHTATQEEGSATTTDDAESSTNTPGTHLHSNMYGGSVNNNPNGYPRRTRTNSANDVPPISTIVSTFAATTGGAFAGGGGNPSATDLLPHNLDSADNRSLASTISDASSERGTVIYGRSGSNVSASGAASAPGIGIAAHVPCGGAGSTPNQHSSGVSTATSNSTRSQGVLFGKSSSLIFPTGVEPPPSTQGAHASDLKAHKINLLLDQCETVRRPFKKKLVLSSMDLTAADVPVKDLYGTSLGNTLHKLALNGNRLYVIPPQLVTCLPVLKTLDLSQCELHQLPERWNLPKLKGLNLSHNRLTEFPEETMLEGLLELQELNLYGNKISVIVVPHNPKFLTKLETLNLGYNELAFIPEDLDRLKALRTLKVMNNVLEKVPMRVCDMELKSLDVSSNPVIQPPQETCERGICSMKRYYHCLRMEEQSKQKALEALQSKAARHYKKPSKTKKVGGVGLSFNLSKPKRIVQVSLGRKTSDDSNASPLNDMVGSPMSNQNEVVSGQHKISPIQQKPSPVTGPTRSVSLPAEQLASAVPGDSPSSIMPVTSEDVRPKSKSMSEFQDKLLIGLPSIMEPAKLPQHPHRLREAAGEGEDGRLSYPSENRLDDFDGTKHMASFSERQDSNLSSKSGDLAMYDNFMNDEIDQVTVNDTLKVIFVGMAMAGKTSMIKRLIEGEHAVIPKRDERTVGVDIYEWDPKIDKRFEHIDNRIQLHDKELEELCGDVEVKFSVWDFAGQHVYHATHELFFSQRALYVLVWDMGATNSATKQSRNLPDDEDSHGAFKLGYDSDGSNSEDNDDFISEEEARRADRALDRDIDEKVQFWVDCIQSSVPGAAILPVASFNDLFEDNDHQEAKRRCDMLKARLLKHEARRMLGIKDRLKEYEDQNKANDEAALRLRKLLGSYTRPKIIFGGEGEDSIVRVSGTKYTGFAELTQRIIDIATGRDKANFRYPIFRGHVGARIPRMRLEVRQAVRRMRDRFKVVEWGFFINELRRIGLTSVEDISDALHFLTNIGELSYFGGVLPDRGQHSRLLGDSNSLSCTTETRPLTASNEDISTLSEEEDDDEDNALLSIDDTSTTMPTTDTGSMSSLGDPLAGGLSQYVFLNPRWLVAAVACILRHDLDREIQETRRSVSGTSRINRADSFYDANMNCPVITAEDACMLWQAKKFTKKAAERAQEYSNNMTVKTFDFLQLLLIRFGVFVPIDLGIEKAFLGGVDFSTRASGETQTPEVITIGEDSASSSQFQATYFFLPSLLGPGEPAEAWTYKSTDAWKATLCHSILFPDGVPPGLMERITASVLSNLYAMAHKREALTVKSMDGKVKSSYEGLITVKEVLCWRTAFLVKLGMKVQSPNGDYKESIVEIFTALVDKDSHLCVGSDSMSVGSRRLVTSGKGQEGDGGRKIWKGGYLVVHKAVQRVMEEYGGLEYEKQGFCPECLAKKAVGDASSWDFSAIRAAVKNGETTIRCRHGHRVDTRLIAGDYDNLQQNRTAQLGKGDAPIVPINDLLRSVVVVGLWDGKAGKVVRVGSGFIADKKRGLIVTASHTLMNIWGDKSTPFGENYYGLRQGMVVIGVIPRKKGEETGTEAVFRYFAKIVSKDPSIDRGLCQMDACILRITTRMEKDVSGSGEGCGFQPERLLLNNPHALKLEKLHHLRITDKCELDEPVRIVGYNQGGEGLMGPGVSLNRYADFARGYVCKKFAGGEGNEGHLRHRFKPREEIVVICPTIGGHSGGPCVNQQGEVIGILSRADSDCQRCYLVPTDEWKDLLEEAKKII